MNKAKFLPSEIMIALH